MFSRYIVPALCATASIQTAAASNRHRHLHKKDAYAATDVVVVTEYVTKTVFEGEEEATSSSKAQSIFAGSHPSEKYAPVATTPSAPLFVASSPVEPPPAPSTTLVPVVKPSPSPSVAAAAEAPAAEPIAAVASDAAGAATSAAAAVESATPSTKPKSSGGIKRGLAFNDVSLVNALAASESKFGWIYNWGATVTGYTGKLPFYPTLWGPTHAAGWDDAAKAAIARGVDALLSFNECDNAGQANMSPAQAAADHQKLMNPYGSDSVRIAAPSISSSQEANQGIDWLKQFLAACDGKCKVDICNAHWYGPSGVAGAQEMLQHLLNVHAACDNKPVWFTEWAQLGGTPQQASDFMQEALHQLDTNSTFDFVEKYSYFYLAPGSLVDAGSTLSSLGKIYATQ